MEREFSAGGVVLRYMRGQWWIAAIQPRDNSDKKSSKKVLALPKGLIDPGEKPADTAVREVREETGLEAAMIAKLLDIRYIYVRSWGDKQKVFKVVSFYLLRYQSGRIGEITPEMEHEVAGAEWIALDEAERRLSYTGERQVVRMAREYVESNELPTTPVEDEDLESQTDANH
jgi:8-oxo-dGTP pyrophosphatase MutT (NUDIX family)